MKLLYQVAPLECLICSTFNLLDIFDVMDSNSLAQCRALSAILPSLNAI